MLKLSIIIPLFNVEEHLSRCLKSLSSQGLGEDEFEIILVDDGSTDSSGFLADTYADKHSNAVVFHQENAGQGKARNVGLDNAHGFYVTFVDADDYIRPDKFAFLVGKCLENNLDACEYQMEKQNPDGSFDRHLVQPFKDDLIYTGEQVLLGNVSIASVCTIMYRRGFLDEHGLRFNEQIKHEDVDFNLRMYPYAKRIMFSSVVGYVYTWNVNSTDRYTSYNHQRRLFISDLYVAQSFMQQAAMPHLSNAVKDLYQRYCNSIVVSQLYHLLFRRNSYSYKDYVEFIQLMKALGIYPIAGKTRSQRTSCLVPFFNQTWLCDFWMLLYKI